MKVNNAKLKSNTYESGRIVILDCFGVTEGLQNGIGFEKLLLQFTLKRKKK